MPTDLTDRPSLVRNPAMRVRRHHSFRPTLDVLPGRIAPSGGFTPAAVAVTPMDAPSTPPSLYSCLPDPNWTMATPIPAVDTA